MRYERLNPEDLDQLVELENVYKRSIGETPLTPRQTASLKEAVTRREICFFVGKEGERLVAMCSVCTVFSTYLCRQGGVFEDFYVAEPYRHQGIARGLTAFVFDCLRAQGVQTLWVGCADGDMAMYQALGFSLRLGNLLTWSAEGA